MGLNILCMTKEISQLLIDTIRKAIKIKETFEIAVDVHLSLSFWLVDFYIYADKNDLNYTHSASIHLDSSDADEELNDFWDLLNLLESQLNSPIINNQLN